jgi:hypothetical protein
MQIVFKMLDPALVIARDRDFWERYNGYLLLFVMSCYLFTMFGLGFGLYYAVSCRKKWGWLLVGVAIAADLAAILSGGFRALPWDWSKSWSEDQPSIQREQYNERGGGVEGSSCPGPRNCAHRVRRCHQSLAGGTVGR